MEIFMESKNLVDKAGSLAESPPRDGERERKDELIFGRA